MAGSRRNRFAKRRRFRVLGAVIPHGVVSNKEMQKNLTSHYIKFRGVDNNCWLNSLLQFLIVALRKFQPSSEDVPEINSDVSTLVKILENLARSPSMYILKSNRYNLRPLTAIFSHHLRNCGVLLCNFLFKKL